ncbi:MAG: penicillin-binding transpeptidase domain-containing protein [Pseudomonadota bacterium]
MMIRPAQDVEDYAWRRRGTLIIMVGAMVMLIGRAIDLQVLNKQFLQQQGNQRHVAVVSVPAYRGKILDRNGEPLAISSPVQTVGVDRKNFKADEESLRKLAALLAKPLSQVRKAVSAANGPRFLYLKRQVDPALANRIKNLQMSGIYFEREFRRFYPAGEVTAHLLGFTDIEDQGQEGIESAYNKVLMAVAGEKRVIRDGNRDIIENVENIRSPVPGRDVVLSIDQRLQYLAYRELKAAVIEHKARAGSLVMLDARTGEVLAVVNQPSLNPNSRKNRRPERYRNRAITDVFEPGSTIKPFVIACALEAGMIRPDTVIDTRPGFFRVGRKRVRDIHNYGVIDITRILQKSSNVGVSKIALGLDPEVLWSFYRRLGFGVAVGTDFPSEASGSLSNYEDWSPFVQATLSYGYGLSSSSLHLARAFSALANDGEMPSVSLLRRNQPPAFTRVMSAQTARIVKQMLETVVTREGTAYRARVAGYRVAGKTGTVKKISGGGYSNDQYLALFAGMAPASDPRLVLLVVIDEPRGGAYYGGTVAAPVFASVMSGALRLLGIAPDAEENMPFVTARPGGTA